MFDGEGKPNVVAAVQRLDDGDVGGVLGIVDEDYDCLMGKSLDYRTWQVDRQGLIRVAAAGLEKELERCIGRLPKVQPWRLVQGHDVLAILRIGLRNVLGDVCPIVGVSDIARVLRAAGRLEGTTLLEDIRRWEGANRPYLVLQ